MKNGDKVYRTNGLPFHDGQDSATFERYDFPHTDISAVAMVRDSQGFLTAYLTKDLLPACHDDRPLQSCLNYAMRIKLLALTVDATLNSEKKFYWLSGGLRGIVKRIGEDRFQWTEAQQPLSTPPFEGNAQEIIEKFGY